MVKVYCSLFFVSILSLILILGCENEVIDDNMHGEEVMEAEG